MNFCRTSGITKSTYEKGEMNGEFKIYELGCLAYEGGVKKGRYHGVGTEYYPMSEQVYLENGEIQYSGQWDYGDYAN